MKKLVVTIPLDGNDLSEKDIAVFLNEAADAAGINLTVSRSASEDEPEIFRSYEIHGEYFTAAIKDSEESDATLAD